MIDDNEDPLSLLIYSRNSIQLNQIKLLLQTFSVNRPISFIFFQCPDFLSYFIQLLLDFLAVWSGVAVSILFRPRCSHSIVTRFFLGLVSYSILFPYFYCYFFFAKKAVFSFQTLSKGTFSLLTCHLQFSIKARVSMTLKRQSMRSLSDHKTARTFCVSQERGVVERMV